MTCCRTSRASNIGQTIKSWKSMSLRGLFKYLLLFNELIMNLHVHLKAKSFPQFLSSTWPEFDPDTAYVVCISVSLGFPYMKILFTFKRKRYCSDVALLWGCYERYNVPTAAIVMSQYMSRYCFTECSEGGTEIPSNAPGTRIRHDHRLYMYDKNPSVLWHWFL